MKRLFLLVPLFASVVAAQTPDRFAFGTGAVGVTTGTPGDPFASAYISIAGDFHVIRNRTAINGGASFQGEILGPDGVTEAHLAAGLAGREGASVFTLTAGPTLARVVRTSFEEGGTAFVSRYEGWAIGVHASAGARVVPIPEVALGVEAFANVNTRTPIYGLRATFGLGRLPPALVR